VSPYLNINLKLNVIQLDANFFLCRPGQDGPGLLAITGQRENHLHAKTFFGKLVLTWISEYKIKLPTN